MIKIIPISILFICLTGCALEAEKKKLFKTTLKHEEKTPIKIIRKVKYVALPGQEKLLPKKPIAKRVSEALEKDPHKILDRRKRATTYGPTRGSFFNSRQVYPFVDGALYKVISAPFKVTDIHLKSGEKVQSLHGGDTLRWKISQSQAGNDDGTSSEHVLVKPVEAGLTTNLVIHTNQRTYHFELVSTDKSYMSSVSFSYENDDYKKAVQNLKKTALKNRKVVSRNVDLKKLNFNYKISVEKGNPRWVPGKVFDDGNRVYVQFGSRLKDKDAPLLFIKKYGEKASLVNYKSEDGYYVVDRLFSYGELRIGVGSNQEVVKIIKRGRR